MAQRYSLFDMYSPVQDREKRRQMLNQFLDTPSGGEWIDERWDTGRDIATSHPALSGNEAFLKGIAGDATGNIPQEPMPQRVDVGAYLDDQSAIQQNRDKWSSRIRAMGGNISFPSLSDDTMRRAGIQDEMIQAEILKRQRAAILNDEIKNIDEWMQWYQKGGYDPHFAKEARTAAQSIFDQRGQERGFEIRETVEARGVRGAELKEEEAVRAQQRFDFAKAEADRKQKDFNAKQTTESRNELISAREDELLRWAASKWWDLEPGERTEAKREEIGREMTVLAENESFQGFEIVAGEVVPKLGRGITTTPPVSFDLDEKSLLDTFRNEAKVVLKDEDKEDEDFVTVPARKYFDQFKTDWDVAADDWDTAQAYTRKIEKAIAADPDIAQENQRAVLKGVLDSLGELEEPVSRPTEPTDPAMLKNQRMFESMVQVAPFPVGGELSTPENIMEAQSGFLRTVQMRERAERASSEHLAQLVDPLMKSRIYAELTGMKEMSPVSRGIASEFDPVLLSMRTTISAIDERLASGKYEDDSGKMVKLTDVDRMNLGKAKEAQLRKYADHWGTTLDYADWRRDPEAYRNRKVNF